MGAPKCGTTAMNDFLAQHPAIFMAQKEIHYFGSDLKMRSRPTKEEYLQNFSTAPPGTKVVGEASVWYLYSHNAAREIHDFCPEARILIMLRNPVEVLYSLHSQHLYNYNEDERDFKKALSLDSERMQGRNLPDSVDFAETPPYLGSVSFSSQVARYLEVFGPQQVHIILYDDFKKDPRREVEATVAFLGLEPWTGFDFRIVNPNKKIRFWYLHRILKRPPVWLKRFIRMLIPIKKIRHFMMGSLFKVNIYFKKRKTLDEDLRKELTQSLFEEVSRLAALIGRDLSAWTD
ncbi:MAG: sulfotransferase [Bacteroidota bacterium]|nr:sulfotransferase [Bacteroidota bacterium]